MSDVATAEDAGVETSDIAPATPADYGVDTGDDAMPVEISNDPEPIELSDDDAEDETPPDEEATAEDEDGDGSDEEGEGDDTPSEVIEFDFGGNKLEIPKDQIPDELAAKVDEFTKETWADYTRKSQAVAEQNESIDQQRQFLEQMTSLNGEALQTYTRGLQLRNEIDRLTGMQDQLWATNPDQARRNSDAINRMGLELSQTIQAVQQFENDLQSVQQEQRSTQETTGKEKLSKYKANFETEIVPEVLNFVVDNFGFTKDEAEANWAINPEFTIMAYESMLYRKMQAEAAKPRTEPAQAAQVKPVQSRGGGRNAPASPDNMSMAQLSRHLGIRN